MKKCKYCKSRIDSEAKICPNCRKHQGSSLLRIFIGVIIGLVLISFMFAYSLSNDAYYSSDYTDNDYVTLAQFNEIKNGMTYGEVVNIVGYDGTLSTESGDDEYNIKMYYWYGKDGISNMTLSFENNILSAKSQIGLE